jgi:hypothetical protein
MENDEYYLNIKECQIGMRFICKSNDLHVKEIYNKCEYILT